MGVLIDTENVINEMVTTYGIKNGIRNEVCDVMTRRIKNKDRLK